MKTGPTMQYASALTTISPVPGLDSEPAPRDIRLVRSNPAPSRAAAVHARVAVQRAGAAHQPRQAPGTPDASCSQALLSPPQLHEAACHGMRTALRLFPARTPPGGMSTALQLAPSRPHTSHPAPRDSLHHRPMKLGWSSGNSPLLQRQGNRTADREGVAGLARRCWRVVHTLCPRKADGRACATRAGPPVEHDRHRHACS